MRIRPWAQNSNDATTLASSRGSQRGWMLVECALIEEELRPCHDPVRSTFERQTGNFWEVWRQDGQTWKEEGAETVIQKWISEGARAANGPTALFPPSNARCAPCRWKCRGGLIAERERCIGIGAWR